MFDRDFHAVDCPKRMFDRDARAVSTPPVAQRVTRTISVDTSAPPMRSVMW